MKKILIVDDSAFMRTILKELLTSQTEDVNLSFPIEIFEADGKVSALKQLKKIKPNLILLDIVMQESETEGLAFIKEVKDTFNTRNIIVISSIGQASILNELRELNIANYLQKPFDRNQVIEAVNQVLVLDK